MAEGSPLKRKINTIRKNLGTSGSKIEHGVQKYRQNTKSCLMIEVKSIALFHVVPYVHKGNIYNNYITDRGG